MKKNKKKCKGTGKAKGFGCGDGKFIFKYGLCQGCFGNWLYQTPEGNEIIKKTSLKAKKQRIKKEKQQHRELKKQVKKLGELKQELQTKVNYIVRMIDAGKGCISCNHGWDSAWTRRQNAGHRKSVGAYENLRFNFDNIFLQCVLCNMEKSGNERAYDEGLIKHYGKEYFERIERLDLKYKSIKLTRLDILEKIDIAKKVIKEIKSGKDYTREELNNIFGIYL